MNLKRSSTMFLKVIIFLAGISVLALCIFLVPEMADFTANLYPNITPIKYLVFIVMYGAAVPFYVALYQAFNLLQYIDENTAFSELSVKALKNIKRCAITISGLYVLSLPLFYFIAKKNGPSYWVSGTHYRFCFARYLRFCCYPPTTSTRGNSHKIRK